MNTVSKQSAASTIEPRLRLSWIDLLDVAAEQIAADSNFFALGGNSMLVLSLHITLAAEFDISITLAELLENADFGRMVSLIYSRL
jgi:acyl carrier protein